MWQWNYDVQQEQLRGGYQPNSRIVGAEAENDKPIRLNLNGISAQRILRKSEFHRVVVSACIFVAPIHDLEGMTVQVNYHISVTVRKTPECYTDVSRHLHYSEQFGPYYCVQERKDLWMCHRP